MLFRSPDPKLYWVSLPTPVIGVKKFSEKVAPRILDGNDFFGGDIHDTRHDPLNRLDGGIAPRIRLPARHGSGANQQRAELAERRQEPLPKRPR